MENIVFVYNLTSVIVISTFISFNVNTSAYTMYLAVLFYKMYYYTNST